MGDYRNKMNDTAVPEKEEIYRIIAENTSDTIVLVDNQAIVRYVSPSFTLLSGYNLVEYEGMDAFEIIHPEDRERVRLVHASVLQTKLPVNIGYRVIHATGQTIYIESRVKPVLDENNNVKYVVAVARDITDKFRFELELEESEQRYKSLFENNLDGVFSLELDNFYFVNANRSFEKITGIDIAKLRDRCLLGMIFDEDHPLVYETLFEVRQEEKPRAIECRLNNGKQGQQIVSITFVPIFLSGKLNGIHGMLKDITQRKIEERELIKSEERSKFLQQSLNRFSTDLANVMKVSDLGNRLVDEVIRVLPVTSVSIEELPRGTEHSTKKTNELWIKIGERQQQIFLRIIMKQTLLKMEEEWLETAVHYVTLLYDNLHLIEDLMKRLEDLVSTNETPKWMLRLLFKLSEKERASLSSDLHDSVLQDLIIWYRKLESLRSSTAFGQETQRELMQIEEGLLDAIHQIRITCNELRPPFLLKMGLVESLKSLFEYTRMFANYEIEFTAEELNVLLNEEQILGIYRIVQELLNNASKHSQAKKITISLKSSIDHIHFIYVDDGVGMDLSTLKGSFQHMGLAGIEKRVLSLAGHIQFHSAPQQGLQVTIHYPKM